MSNNSAFRAFIALALGFSLFSCEESKENLSVMTYNIRLRTESDGDNYWDYRKEKVLDLIDSADVDIMGFQEALHPQVEYLRSRLIDYEMYGVGRDDGKTEGEYSPVFWKKEKFKRLNSGHFWLREISEEPGTGWDANYNRIATWVILETPQKDSLFVMNTHYDHQGEEARKNSSLLILEKLKEYSKNLPIVLIGDFNADLESEPYQILEGSNLLKDSFVEINSPLRNHGTFAGGFNVDNLNDRKIDHVFTNDLLKTESVFILTNQKGGYYPSDHLPVGVIFNIE